MHSFSQVVLVTSGCQLHGFLLDVAKKKRGGKPQLFYRLVYSALFIEHQPVRVEVVLMGVQQVYVAEIVAALGAAGVGVVQGQVEDLKREGGTDGASGGPAPVPVEVVDFVYTHKTADLFVEAAAMGGYAGGGSEGDVAALRRFALNLGLAFQYEDDLLDGDSPYSREKTEALVRETTAASIAALEALPGDTSFLKALAEKLVGRSV